jgi:hypothetical protein
VTNEIVRIGALNYFEEFVLSKLALKCCDFICCK